MPTHTILILLVTSVSLARPAVGAEPRPETPASGPVSPTAEATRHPPGITPAQEREVLAFLQEHFPASYDLAERFRREQPSRYFHLLRSRLHWLQELKRMPEKVRQASILQAQTATLPWRISRQWRRQKDAEAKKKLQAELAGVVTGLFGAEQVILEHRVAKLARSVKRRRGELAERARNRRKHVAEIVERHLSTAGRKAPEKHAGAKPAGSAPSVLIPVERRRRKLTEERRTRTLEFLKKHLPEHRKRVVELRKNNPASYERTLQRWFWWVRRWERMPPQVRKAYVRKTRALLTTEILARRIRQAPAEKKKTLTDELRKAAGEAFDSDLALRRHQLDRLEERIHALRDELLIRANDRDRLIIERVERYLKVTVRQGQSPQQSTSEPATRPSK